MPHDRRLPLETALDRWHRRAREVRLLRPFTLVTRVLLAVGFIPPGLTKVLGHRFANPEILTPDTPIGYFFDAFFQAEGYYAFVGAAQVLAGLLLLVPRTATLGALLYLPMITNIFAITWSMHFRGTWVVAGLMLLANLYLLAWDYDRLKYLFFPPPAASATEPAGLAQPLAYLGLVAGGLLVGLALRGYMRGGALLAGGGLFATAAGFLLVRALRSRAA